jgi:Asp-tRNA(Asn)/Glu-tRNA(Gln) amidotransferase A subunit family amidase
MHGGHPVSLQLVGDAFDEASVLAAMAHCERIGLTDIDLPDGYAPLLQG